MQLENKVFCHWDWVRFVSEKHLKQDDGTFKTLSVTEENKKEYMIFLGKDDPTSEYEVRIYKSEPTDRYVPHDSDKIKHYEENDEYATFFFDEYEDALHFVALLPYYHEEYKVRPTQKI